MGKQDDETVEQAMTRVARQVASAYAKRCWWAERDDLEQQCWTIVLEVRNFWAARDEAGNIDMRYFGGTAYVAAMRQMQRYLWRESALVSLSDHECNHEVAGMLRRAPIENPETGADWLVSETPTAHELLDVQEREVALRLRVVALMGGTLSPWVEAAMAVVLDQEKPALVAKKMGLPVWQLYREVSWMRQRVRNDGILRDMLMQREESV